MRTLSHQAVVKTRRFAYLAAATGAIACAQQAAPAPPASPAFSEPPGAQDEVTSSSTDLGALEAKLAAAERDLNAQLGAAPGGGEAATLDLAAPTEDKAVGQSKPSAQPAPAPPPKASRAEKPTSVGGATAQSESSAPSCDTICKALASMERSADRICELTSAEDTRCTRARERVDSATKRVELSGCGCPE
jgi:hypothetical protein